MLLLKRMGKRAAFRLPGFGCAGDDIVSVPGALKVVV